MKVLQRVLDCYVLVPEVHVDQRGFFMETWTKLAFQKLSLDFNFLQDNQSFSVKAGTLRGIHFQVGESAQAKLVRCTKNKVLSVAVDLRGKSPTFKKWFAVELSEENKKEFLIPRGFGHAILTLEDNVEIQYKVDNYRQREKERTIAWNDPEIGIDWNIQNPILSEKDAHAPHLKNMITGFEDWS